MSEDRKWNPLIVVLVFILLFMAFFLTLGGIGFLYYYAIDLALRHFSVTAALVTSSILMILILYVFTAVSKLSSKMFDASAKLMGVSVLED